ncbi:hypothetical protein J0J37_22825, partial [Vibrio vulnificus]|uniref:hypothetical protein n=1 Tax=Vibrio vulnificus TaxID=672 RepID=UPI0019D42CF2
QMPFSLAYETGKLGTTWECPYQIAKVVGHGAYKIQTKKGKNDSYSWNTVHLKQYQFKLLAVHMIKLKALVQN